MTCVRATPGASSVIARLSTYLAAYLLPLLACDPGRGVASQPPGDVRQPQPQQDPPVRPPDPAPATGSLDLVIADWPAADRAELERMVADGQAILLHAGPGTLELEPECSADTLYSFTGQRPRGERISGDGSDFSATIVGTWTAAPVAADRLRGRCERVTHVVEAIATGAFTASSSSTSRTSADFDIGGAVVGGSSSSSRSSSSSGGESSACAGATRRSPRPPARCDAFIRLSLRPLAPR